MLSFNVPGDIGLEGAPKISFGVTAFCARHARVRMRGCGWSTRASQAWNPHARTTSARCCASLPPAGSPHRRPAGLAPGTLCSAKEGCHKHFHNSWQKRNEITYHNLKVPVQVGSASSQQCLQKMPKRKTTPDCWESTAPADQQSPNSFETLCQTQSLPAGNDPVPLDWRHAGTNHGDALPRSKCLTS